MRVTQTFDQVWARREIKAVCAGGCGRKLTRVVKDFNTVNPFNRNEDGTVKDRGEVQRDIDAKVKLKAARMLRDGIYCKECHEEERQARSDNGQGGVGA